VLDILMIFMVGSGSVLLVVAEFMGLPLEASAMRVG
jgi:hypothetical protein